MTRRGIPLQWLQERVGYAGSECLIWPFSKISSNGYAQIRFQGKATTAARVMCVLRYGNPPSSLHEAAHSCGCGDKGCVNPNHLRWATSSENKADMILHGTRLRGSKAYNAKITEKDVKAIRELNGQLPRREIAEIYGISRQSVNDIVWGNSWGWL